MTSPDDACVPFEYGGRRWEIPVRLIRARQEWETAHALCQQLQRRTDEASRAAYDAAWDRRMAATLRLGRDPWLTAHENGRHEADAALRACARSATIETVP
ncbi:hypothetical protein [Actinospica robiniae]|uniref:hypothetical protein n=1 Tax=Actinospica robiniae TaxID=304901 RepID=UPI000429CCCF|nr:hypothetical protein [Actinospica robiniae]